MTSVTDYAPGTVALATVQGVPNVRVFITAWKNRAPILTAEDSGGHVAHSVYDVTDIRPLVVLDIEDVKTAKEALSRAMVPMPLGPHHSSLLAIHRAIEEQAKPPRPSEPGLYGVVEARQFKGHVDVWHRFESGWSNDDGTQVSWEELIDPKVIRDGIQRP